MAFDRKRQRTFKELIALTKIPHFMKSSYNPLGERVYARFGMFYATNGLILVAVEYPEFEHIADDEWMVLERYEDITGKLLKTPELSISEKQYKKEFFEQFFIKELCAPNENPQVDVRLLANVLNVFKINDLTPTIMSDGTKYELSAHNKDVSIKAVVMGLGDK